MQVSEIDSVKIYNLSAGKALPDVCTIIYYYRPFCNFILQYLQYNVPFMMIVY